LYTYFGFSVESAVTGKLQFYRGDAAVLTFYMNIFGAVRALLDPKTTFSVAFVLCVLCVCVFLRLAAVPGYLGVPLLAFCWASGDAYKKKKMVVSVVTVCSVSCSFFSIRILSFSLFVVS